MIASRVQASRSVSILRETCVNTEARSEFEAHYYDRVGKIREAATAAIRQLGQLRSTGPTPRETLDAEVARIAQEKLHPYRCDLVVHRMG